MARGDEPERGSYIRSLRRVPTQQRSWDKVARILDAAEQLLVELGYDQTVASPALLIERAKVSGGSFYTYFSSPEAVTEALALRFMEQVQVEADLVAQEVHRHWRDAAQRFFDTFIGFYQPRAVRQLWLDGHLSPAAREADDHANSYLARRLEDIMAAATEPGPALRPLAYRVAIEIYDYVMRLAFRQDGEEREELLEEAKGAAITYLASAAGG